MGNKWQENMTTPELKSKIENKVNTCVAEQTRTCLSKDCSEMTACINKLQTEGEEKRGQGGLDPALKQELNEKLRDV